MTYKEQKTIEDLSKLINDFRKSNEDFKNAISSQINAINEKVNEKHIPIVLEKFVLNGINDTIAMSLHEYLKSYESPFKKLFKNLFEKYEKELYNIMDSLLSEQIKTEAFKNEAKTAIVQKISRVLVQNVEGILDKSFNELRQDALFRSKLTIVIDSLIKEYLGDKK